jgi:hypothetical protein
MTPKSILTAILFVLTPVLGLAQSVISVNIAGGNANSPSAGGGGGEGIVTGNAGLGQLGNWNNAIGASNVGAGLTVPALVDSTGAATAATFSWVTNNTWSTSTADGAGGDVDMMSGYIDNFHANGSINVAGLGPEFTGPGYTVLVYYNTDNSGMTAGFTVTDNAGNTDTRFGHQLIANANYPLAGGTDGYVISTETANNTLFSANIVQLSGFSGSEFTMTGNAGTVGSARARPNAIQIISLGGAEPLPLEVSGRDMLTFRWPSQRGQLYTLRSETDPSVADPIDWPVFDGHQDIEATPPENTLTIPRPPEAKRFFVIEGFPKPPVVIFEDNFDDRNDLAPWTNSSPDGNAWALGVPTAPLGPTAFSRPNVVGTVLAGDYIASGAVGTYVVSTLRSPAMDLSGIVSGTISYQRFVDMEDPIFDKATVNLLDASDFLLIEVLENDIGNVSVNWEGVSHDIPAAAIGKSVIFEIVFSADEFDTFQTGLVIDDFKVEGVEP